MLEMTYNLQTVELIHAYMYIFVLGGVNDLY